MQTVPESPTAVDCPRSPEQDENVMPPHRYSISPGAYSPYGARDNRRTSQLYSPFRMPGDSPAASPAPKKYGAIGKPSSSLANALEKRKRQLSALTNGLWSSFSVRSAAEVNETAPTPSGGGSGSPLKRGRRMKAPPIAPPPMASVATKFAEGIAKLPPTSKMLRDASTKVASAGQSLQAAARATLQAVDDEADLVFDGVEQQIEAFTSKVRAATAGIGLVRRKSRDEDAPVTGAGDDDGSAKQQSAASAADDETHKKTAVVALGSQSAAVETALASVVDSVWAVSGAVEVRIQRAEEHLLAVGGKVESVVSEGVSGVQQSVSATASAVQGRLGAVSGVVSDVVADQAASAASSLKVNGETTLRAVEEIEASLDETLDRAVEDALGAASRAASSVADSAATLFSPVSSVAEDLAETFPEVRDSVRELSAGVSAGNAYIAEVMSHTVSEVRGVFGEDVRDLEAAANVAMENDKEDALVEATLAPPTPVVIDDSLDDELEAALAEEDSKSPIIKANLGKLD